jgi:hypothetical protein
MYTREEVMTYIDKYGLYHHKPCVDGEPSSNNGWLYTAYARKLGLGINRTRLDICYAGCMLHPTKLMISRLPGKTKPPMSRDEILGLVELGYLVYDKTGTWNFSPRPIPKFNIVTLIKQLKEVKDKHRNYFWENNLDQLYRFAFSVPLVDRHYCMQKVGEFNLFYWAIAKIDSMSSKTSGIRWLKYGKSLAAMQEEFPEDHPLRSK